MKNPRGNMKQKATRETLRDLNKTYKQLEARTTRFFNSRRIYYDPVDIYNPLNLSLKKLREEYQNNIKEVFL